jgi:hypothetical protein
MPSSASTFIGGGLNDKIWVAPKGTAMPTSLTSAPNVAFKDLGYLGDAGIEVNQNVDRSEFKAHQGGTIIRRKVTESGRTLTFSALEHTLGVLDLVYPGSTWTDVTTYVKGVIPEGVSTVEKAWIFDTYDTANALQKRFAFTGEATNTGSFTFGVEDMVAYEFEIAMYGVLEYYDNTAQLITDVV